MKVRGPESEGIRAVVSGQWSVASAESTINAAPRREDSHLVPGVEENDAEAGEVLDVPRHEGKAVFKRRGGDHAIRHLEWRPS